MANTASHFEASVSLAYIETTIPPGTTLGEYRRSRPQRRSRWHRLRHVPALAPRARALIYRAHSGLPGSRAGATIGRDNRGGQAVGQSFIDGDRPCRRAVGPALPHQQPAHSNQIGPSR
jgi:hypothetical protein